MVSAPKIVGVSCAFVLCLGVSNVTGAAEEFGLSTGVEDTKSCTDKNVEREVGVMKCREAMAADTIEGKVLRVEGNNYLIQRSDGREVRLHADANTQRMGPISQGDRIEAKVNEMNHEQVLSIRTTK
jgi:hypothetical protein